MPKPPSLYISLRIFGAGALFVLFQLLLQSSPSVLRDGVVVDFSLSNAGFGGFSASFYFLYILIQVPSGLLVARYGPRLVLSSGALLCAVGCLALSFSQSIFWADASRILMGLGAGPTVVCTMTLGARWFDARSFPLLVALTEMAGMVGVAFGQEILGFTVAAAGWRLSMLGCGVVSLGLSALLWGWVRDFPRQRMDSDDQPDFPGFSPLLRQVLRPRLFLAALAGGMVATAGMAFGLLWAVPFFEEELRLTLPQASMLSSLYFWGALPGMLFFGWVGRRGPRAAAGWLAAGAVATTVSLYLVLFVAREFFPAAVATFLLGAVSSSYVLAFPLVRHEAGRGLSAPALGVANMAVMGAGCWVFQPLIGWLAGVKGEGVPDAQTLSILIWCQLVALLFLSVRWFFGQKTSP